VLATLPAGALYTDASDGPSGPGVALIEAYRRRPRATDRAASPVLSARERSATGGHILIAGFADHWQRQPHRSLWSAESARPSRLRLCAVTWANPQLQGFSGQYASRPNDDWGGKHRAEATGESVRSRTHLQGCGDVVLHASARRLPPHSAPSADGVRRVVGNTHRRRPGGGFTKCRERSA